MTDNKYNYGREIIFELRACHAISAEVYMHWLEKIDKEEQLITPIVSTRTFENECELYVDTETDEWVLKHKGVIKKRAKSKFECLLTKQELKKRLGV